MAELPVYDANGGSLVSFNHLDGATAEELDGSTSLACSIVVIERAQQVLLGFNANRQQWELPGGSVEASESALTAALRELEEETGIRTDRALLVASAEFTIAGDATKYLAAVFTIHLDFDPDLVASDELTGFLWWDPTDDEWDGLSPLDADIARRCLSRD
jgi:8-oxo-dGTP pyrophosphatase MutT (NUDIX family)